MNIRYELFKNSKNVDLRPYEDIIIYCFHLYFPECRVEVEEHEIIILDYPEKALKRDLLRKVSEELMQHDEMLQHSYTPVTRRLLKKKR